jgi:ABC-2 type transport system permease protein
MRQDPAWRIVDELKKQYEVRSLNPAAPVPDDVDVLMVPQVSSLTAEQVGHVETYVDAGRPALLFADPMPVFDVRLAPSEPKLPPPGQGGMFGGSRQAPEPKGDFRGLLERIGVRWHPEKILYDTYNPHPAFAASMPHIVFVSERPDGTDPFAPGTDVVVEGLTEVVVLFGGELEPASGYEESFTPLLLTGESAGFNLFADMVTRHMLFGVQGPIMPRRRSPITGENHVLAARVERGGSSSDEDQKPRDVIVIADLDLIGDQFFAMHARGGDIDNDGLDDIRFDNVTFLLNCVDSLAGDDRFVALRKRKAGYRRLTEVDDLTREARSERESRIQEANAAAEDQLAEAQAALDAAVEAIRGKEGLDETTKAVMVKSAEAAENRRLKAKQEKIERDKTRAITKIEAEHARKIDEIRNQIRLTAVLLPPVPALVLGAVIFARKRRRERETIPESRKPSAARSKEGRSA